MGAGGEPHALHICGKGGLTGSTRIMPQDLVDRFLEFAHMGESVEATGCLYSCSVIY